MKTNQEQKIETAITFRIDQVERFSLVAPLRLLEVDGDNDDIGRFTFLPEHETRFYRFEPGFQHLLETLDPDYVDDENEA
jgi:hypothetical protein